MKLARQITLQLLLALSAIVWIVSSPTVPLNPGNLFAGAGLPSAGGPYAFSHAARLPILRQAPPALDSTPVEQGLLSEVPGLADFATRMEPAGPEQVIGLYAPGVMALVVEQQPPDQPLYVTGRWGYATQFERPMRYQVIGLLAHNTQSGILFYQLEPGDPVYLVFGDGRVGRYRVGKIAEYQKLEPQNSRSDYVDLTSGKTLATTEVYDRYYHGGPRLVLQTCLEYDGDASWGVRFIVAEPD